MYYFSSKMAKKAVFLSFFSQFLSVFYKNWMHFLKNIFFMQKNSFHLKRIFLHSFWNSALFSCQLLFSRPRRIDLEVWRAFLSSYPDHPLQIQLRAPAVQQLNSITAPGELCIKPYAFLPIWIERLFLKTFGRWLQGLKSIWSLPAA